MKAFRLMVSAFATLTFAAEPSLASPFNEQAASLIETIRSQSENAGMAVAVVRSNEILHLSTHGLADVETQNEVTTKSLFMIGSTTKAMTATLAGYLVQDNRLDWDDRLQSWLPNLSLRDEEASENITLRDCLLHRSGLPRHDFALISRQWSSDQFLSLLPLLEPSAPFRSVFQYQNLMYLTAGIAAAQAAESTWEDAMQEKIFGNLEMLQSRPTASRVHPEDTLAMPHVWTGNKMVKIPHRNIDGLGPAGSVYSSIEDMAKWVQFNLRQGVSDTGNSLDRTIMHEIHRPQILTGQSGFAPEFSAEGIHYSLGWMVAEYRGKRYIFHGGGIDGFLTTVGFLPEADLGVVVLTNGGNLPPDVIALSLLDHFLEAEPVDWLGRIEAPKPQPLPEEVTYPESYEGAEGEFHHNAYGTLAVRSLPFNGVDALIMQLNESISFTVIPWILEGTRHWEFKHSGLEFRFHIDEANQVNAIEANLEPEVAPIKFVRQ